MKELGIFVVALLCSSQPLAAVYKCKTDTGAITYSDKPCVGNRAVLPGYKYRDPGAPASQVPGPESEHAHPGRVDTPAVGARADAPTTENAPKTLVCGDIEVISFAPFNTQTLGGVAVDAGGGVGVVVGGSVHTIRCAKVAFRLSGQGSRIGNSEYAKEVARSLVAVFADGSTQPGSSGSIRGEPVSNRVSADSVAYGSFCFGSSDFEIVALRCR